MKNFFLLSICCATGALLQLSAQTSVTVANFEGNGTDKMTTANRIRQEGGSPFEVVDNPLQNATNNSGKVLKVYDVTSAGRLAIGLCGYWNGSVFVPYTQSSDSIVIYDQATSTAKYNAIRFKLLLEGTTTNTNLLPYVEFYDYGPIGGQPSRTGGAWTNTREGVDTWNDWNTFTFPYTPNNFNGRIILVINNGVWAMDPNVTYYVDDIEFINTGITSINTVKTDELQYSLDGNNLTVLDIPTDTALSICNISGQTLLNTKVSSSNFSYVFPTKGVYIVSLKSKNGEQTQKILVK